MYWIHLTIVSSLLAFNAIYLEWNENSPREASRPKQQTKLTFPPSSLFDFFPTFFSFLFFFSLCFLFGHLFIHPLVFFLDFHLSLSLSLSLPLSLSMYLFLSFSLFLTFSTSTFLSFSFWSGSGEKPRGVWDWESGRGHSPFSKKWRFILFI